jgi:acetyl-CoA acetyltransferase
MKKTIREMRPVYVVGIGLHKYQHMSDTTFVTLGLTAVRQALRDAGIEFRDVDSAYTGTALIGMAVSRPILRHLGASGIPMAQVENASASGSTAFRQACLDVASGISDVSLAIGVDKPAPLAAAVIVASEDAIAKLGIDRKRAVKVIASVTRTEHVYRGAKNFDAELTRETTAQAYEEAGVGPKDLDLIELHDAFTIEELLYVEAMGLCGEGEGATMIGSNATDIGGKCAISASGGLLAMGHPIGPTGAGQVVEITRQLRGEAGARQHPNARLGLAHMVGIGAVCVVHILEKGA